MCGCMENCLICKEFVGEDRFRVKVTDNRLDTGASGCLCRFCYNKFIDSYNNRGFFKVAKMVNWLKGKDPMRVI